MPSEVQSLKTSSNCVRPNVILPGFLLLVVELQADFWTKPKRAIKWTFKRADDEILETLVDSRGGSTVVTAILINGEKLVVANVGDSLAILCRNGKAKQITMDHEPEKK